MKKEYDFSKGIKQKFYSPAKEIKIQDYTKWRKNLFKGMSIEEISKAAMDYQRLKDIEEDKKDYLSAVNIKKTNKKWIRHEDLKNELGLN